MRILILFAIPVTLLAHGDEVHLPSWTTWNFEWHILTGLGGMSGIYFWGLRNAKKRSNSPIAARLTFFTLALIALIAALISPIDALSEKLGWVHMVQHTLILMVAAPLLALAAPEFYVFLALPKAKSPLVRKTYKFMAKISRLKRPILAWSLYASVLYIWHIPKLYESALNNSLVHDFQHIGFFAVSFLFWRTVLYPFGKRLDSGVAVLYLFVAMLHAIALGVLMALSPAAWYEPYYQTAPLYGFTALADQQIAGFIMWMPAGISFLVVGLISIKKILKDIRPYPQK